MDAKFQIVLNLAEALGPMSPDDIAGVLSLFIDRIPKATHQLAIVAYTAIGQHMHISPIVSNDIMGGGAPLFSNTPDIHFNIVIANPSVAEYLNGWPVNVSFHGDQCFMHFKYFGVTISEEGNDDYLNPFIIPPKDTPGWNEEDTKSIIKGVYVMFRNMLSAGMSVPYMKRVLMEQITQTVSPFSHRYDVLPLSIAYLNGMLASDAIVEDTLKYGAYEVLDAQCQEEAEMLHSHFPSPPFSFRLM
jgi:hypothetical protein